MRLITLIIMTCLTSSYKAWSQSPQPIEWNKLISSSDRHLKLLTANSGDTLYLTDTMMLQAIQMANEDFSMGVLVSMINVSSQYYNQSKEIAVSLTKWLREDHPIYKGKTAGEADRLRGYLLFSLSKFPPNAELYDYVKFELLFANNIHNLTAAAVTARNFPAKSLEIIKLIEHYLNSSFHDEWVDITTPELNYPLLHPTKARYEIIETLATYGESAYSSVKLLDELISSQALNVYGIDTNLCDKAAAAAHYIRKVTPICCQKEVDSNWSEHNIKLINKNNRKIISVKDMILLDQDANSVKFADLKGKPFVLTFFYTQCVNSLKCASTVDRLGNLQKEFINNYMAGKIGIYGMTYDPDFDSPSIMKNYGELYGVQFTKNVKFLKTVQNSGAEFFTQLQLRVNYGAGSVNQHGIQLFIFDKKGRLAGISDNDRWSVSDVQKCLIQLIGE